VIERRLAVAPPPAARPPVSRGWPATSLGDGPLGALPVLSVVGALGLVLVSLAHTGARFELEWSVAALWTGLIVLFLPIAARLASAGAPRRERIGLVLVLGLGLYLVKVFHSPLAFTFHDELAHWRTAHDIVQTGQLFGENPIIGVSPYYPGLEIVTVALTSLGGFPIYVSGLIVLGVARVVFVLALFLLYEQVSGSARVGGLGTLLYMANPNFVYFDAQYSYESLALPFAALALFAAAHRARARTGSHLVMVVTLLLAMAATVMTHHLTSYALVSFLAVWTIATVYARGRRAWPRALARLGPVGRDPDAGVAGTRWGPGGMALLGGIMTLTWLVYVASLTVGYLAPVLGSAVGEMIRLIAGETMSRQLFRDYTGHVAPIWERVTGFASVILILILMPFGLYRIWLHHRRNALALALAAGAAGYPVSLALRLTYFGAETSNRTSEFLFVAIAFVLALGSVELWLGTAGRWQRVVPLVAVFTVIFLGGVIVGWPPTMRLPGPYLVAADTRSIEPAGQAAAGWARTTLGPGNRVATDRSNGLLMGSVGEQLTIRTTQQAIGVAWAFFAPTVGDTERSILSDAGIRYVIVDRRLSTSLPVVGIYFEMGEPNTYAHATPIDAAALAKLDGVDQASRLYDGGDIAIYDVGAWLGTR
jgi:hypothetical protein